MSSFPAITFEGRSYALSHLDPFKIAVEFKRRAYTALVIFSSHCFTEKGETRAFNADRYRLSLSLPGMIRALGNQTVYHTRRGSFFFVRNKSLPEGEGSIPYAVFFRVHKADRNGVDVIVSVESAYAKSRLAFYAQPVKFPRVINAVVNRTPLSLGPRCKIKRA